MDIEVIRSVSQFEQMAEQWNSILKEGASDVPFLRHEYLKTWWSYMGGGEWEEGELYLVVARKDAIFDGDICAIAPLFFTNNRQGIPVLMLLGSIEISDFLDVICPPEELPAFLDNLLDHLDVECPFPWQKLEFFNLLEDSPTLPALETAALKRNWKFHQECLQHSPYVPLPGDWEGYLAGIEKKQRHEIRRKIRRLEQAGIPFRWYIVEDADQFDAEIDEFMIMMEQDEEKRAFLTERMRLQLRETIRAAYNNHWLQLAFLEINGEKAAGYLNFDYNQHIWVYNSGLNLKMREYSPGWVLLGYLLQWANEHQRKSLDFMRGDEEYKYRFGGVDRFVVRATVSRV